MKKALALALCVCIIFTPIPPAFASDNTEPAEITLETMPEEAPVEVVETAPEEPPQTTAPEEPAVEPEGPSDDVQPTAPVAETEQPTEGGEQEPAPEAGEKGTESGEDGEKTTDAENGEDGGKTTDAENGEDGGKTTDAENGEDGEKTTDAEGGEDGEKPTDTEDSEDSEKTADAEKKDDEEPEPVSVLFVCTPETAQLQVFRGGVLVQSMVGGGSLELIPGDYTYIATCDGFVPLVEVHFTVAELGQMTIEVTLEQGSVDEELFPWLEPRTSTLEPLVVESLEPDPSRRIPAVFFQTDPRWGGETYYYSGEGSGNSISASGCGLLAYTNAVYYLNGYFVDPLELADYSAANGFHVKGGTRGELFESYSMTDSGKAAGVYYAGRAYSLDELREAIERGCVAIASIPGHFISIVDYDPTIERFLILDPYPNEYRATQIGYVWLTAEELGQIPSLAYETRGVTLDFALLNTRKAIDIACVRSDGEETEEACGSFDVWINGMKVADDQSVFHDTYPDGTEYRIGDIHAGEDYLYYAIEPERLVGIADGEDALIALSFLSTAQAAELIFENMKGALLSAYSRGAAPDEEPEEPEAYELSPAEKRAEALVASYRDADEELSTASTDEESEEEPAENVEDTESVEVTESAKSAADAKNTKDTESTTDAKSTDKTKSTPAPTGNGQGETPQPTPTPTPTPKATAKPTPTWTVPTPKPTPTPAPTQNPELLENEGKIIRFGFLFTAGD